MKNTHAKRIENGNCCTTKYEYREKIDDKKNKCVRL